MNETDRLNNISKASNYNKGINAKMTQYSARLFLRHMEGSSVLELGPAEGLMTDILYSEFPDYTIVDGAEDFVSMIKRRYPEIKAHIELFEEYETDKKFDNIVLGHVLEHVIDPVAILQKCRRWLTEKGKVLAAVPNANSLHRQVGVCLGMIHQTDELTDGDRRIGHRRVYNETSFKEDFLKAGLNIITMGGYWLKPLSNKQIEATWDDKLIDVYMQLGEAYPQIAGNIYIIAGN